MRCWHRTFGRWGHFNVSLGWWHCAIGFWVHFWGPHAHVEFPGIRITVGWYPPCGDYPGWETRE